MVLTALKNLFNPPPFSLPTAFRATLSSPRHLKCTNCCVQIYIK